MLALCAFSLYADTGGSSAVGSAVRGVGLGRTTVAASHHTDHRLVTARRCPHFVQFLS